MRYPLVLAFALVPAAQRPAEGIADHPPRVVLLARDARDSMSVVYRQFNAHWDELGELNTLERMLGTVRPTQLEYLGCLQGSVRGDTVRIERWQPAADMKQLQLAVAGNCDTVSHLLGTWHTHPYRADPQNLPIKERSLSAQDLETFRAAPGLKVTLVMWDVDSLDAALKDGQAVVHPAAVSLSQ
jgi:hypothetical protein